MTQKNNMTGSSKKAFSPSDILSGASPFLKQMDLTDIVRLLKRRAALVSGVIISFTLLALLTALLITPRYRAEAVVMVDARQTRVMDAGAVLSGLPMENTALRSEIDIITSRTLIDRVIEKNKLMDDSEMNPQGFWDKVSPANWFGGKTVSHLESSRRQARVVQQVQDRLSVTNDGHSYSIRIRFDSTDPQKASLLANAFANEYLDDQLETKYEATARATKWLENRLGSLKEQVEASEEAVRLFREQNKLIEVQGSTLAARQMEEINKALVTSRGKVSQAEARYRSMKGMIDQKGGYESAADVLSSPLIQRLREQEASLRRREAEMSSRYGALHPKMQNVKAEYVDLQKKIQEEVQKIVNGLANEVTVERAQENQLVKELARLEKKAGVEMNDTVKLNQLKREADATRTLYETFLARFKQTSEQQDMQVADSRLIAKADIPLKAAFPIIWLFVLVGFVVGVSVAVTAAYLLEYFDRGFRSAGQVEDLFQMPVVGVIPSLEGTTKKTPEDYVLDKPMSAYSEALRTVRTAIHFSNVDHPPKTVMVTSSVPSEGKTTFCLSLARSLAKAGNHILLIDADLRRPRVASATRMQSAKGGLAALLAGDCSFEDVVLKDKRVDNLDMILTSGKTPNAQDLLGSNQMKMLIDDAAQRYDLVIVDTPPILAVSDAAVVSRMVDTSVFVIRWATTPRDAADRAIQQLRQYGCKIAGIVMTRVNTKEHVKYGEEYYHQEYQGYYTN